MQTGIEDANGNTSNTQTYVTVKNGNISSRDTMTDLSTQIDYNDLSTFIGLPTG